MIEWADPIASDNSGKVSVTCDPQSRTNFTIGETTIICDAVDESGNKAQCYFKVIVTGRLHFVCLLPLKFLTN